MLCLWLPVATPSPLLLAGTPGCSELSVPGSHQGYYQGPVSSGACWGYHGYFSQSHWPPHFFGCLSAWRPFTLVPGACLGPPHHAIAAPLTCRSGLSIPCLESHLAWPGICYIVFPSTCTSCVIGASVHSPHCWVAAPRRMPDTRWAPSDYSVSGHMDGWVSGLVWRDSWVLDGQLVGRCMGGWMS